MKQTLPEKITLKLNQNPEINLFTHHSLPLLIPVSEEFDYWRLCNFINIFYHFDYPTSFDYTDYQRYYTGVFDIATLEYDDLDSIDRTIYWKQQLCKEKYIYIWLNQKYLPGSFSYQKRDDMHPVLIYAYEGNKFFAKAFDVNNAIYALEFLTEDLEYAFSKTQAEYKENINDDDMIMLIRQKKFSISYIKNRHFVYSAFYWELSDYYYGHGSNKGWYRFFQENESYLGGHPEVYGFKISELLLQHLRTETELRCMDYRLVHMITENKSLIAERLSAIGDKYDLSQKLKDLAEKYKVLSGKYHSFRKLYMMLSLKETKMRTFYPIPRDLVNLNKLASSLSDLVAEEKILMEQILSAVEENYIMSAFSPAMQKLENYYLKDGYCYINIAGAAYPKILSCIRNKVPYRFLEGSDGSKIEYETTLLYDSVMSYPIKNNITWVRYPIRENETDKMPSFYGCKSSAFSGAAVSASSIHNTDTGSIPEAKNVLIYDDLSFWSPEISDRNPFLIFTLPREEVFQCCAIAEYCTFLDHEASICIKHFAIDVKAKNGRWREVVKLEKQEKRKTFSAKFRKVVGKEFRLRILDPQESFPSGHPLRISYFYLF